MILLGPGPVYVPEEIRREQNKEMITHRSGEFSELYKNLVERLKGYLNAYEAHILTSSGTLGLEALILNIVKPDEKIICLTNGEFGNKLGKTAQIYANAQIHSIDAGTGWNLERAKKIIDESNAAAIAMVYNETGYGVRNHVKEIIKYAKSKGMYTILDCISAWPGTPMDMKEYGLDGFVTGSQKGPSCPPGLALIGLSRDASERIASRDKIPSFYCDLREYKKRYEKDFQTPFTPAISLMWALRKSFDLLDKETIPKVIERHKELSGYVRKRVSEIGFELIPEPGFESYTVTAFKGGENPKEIRKKLKEEYGIIIVGCKGVYTETGLRISNMGHVTKEMLDKCLNALEKIKKG
ncbi:MAG: alanine--glyoxylate aminotransferase family protein [Candidatus Micrarchaeia archaeon]